MKEVPSDIYLETHAMAPFTSPESLDIVIEKVAAGLYDSAFLAQPLHEFLWKDDKPLNFDPLHFPRTQDLPDLWQEAAGAYVFTRETFEKYRRRVGVQPYIHPISAIEAVDIDYPVDFEIANAIYKEVICKNMELGSRL